MKALLTGSTGFLGRHIFDVLKNSYAVDTISRTNATICADLTNCDLIFNTTYDLVVHAAGKAHSVPQTPEQKQAFFNTNITGTLNLLKGLEKQSKLPAHFIFISSVAVYGVEAGLLLTEDAPLQAQDAYGKSKIEAENMIISWCAKHHITCTILRLPLLVGNNPPGNLGAMINGIKKNYYFNIDGGKAKKSIVLANDVAMAIPVAARVGGIYNLTDSYHPTFSELSGYIAQQLNKSKPLSIPKAIAHLMAKIGDLLGSNAPINSRKLSKITSDLTFDDSKAVKTFGWKPTPVLKGFKIK